MAVLENGNVGIGTSNPGATLEITNIGDNQDILKITTDIAWKFYQEGTGPQTALCFHPVDNQKSFKIKSADKSQTFIRLYADNYNAVSNAGLVLVCQDGGNVGIGTSTPAASATLDISSTTKGFLPPRLSQSQIDAISGPPAGLMVFHTNINKPQYYNGIDWRNFDDTFTIGHPYEGGIIFYIDTTGQHGLIAATSDQGDVPWGCYGTTIGGTSTAIYTGQANTSAIVTGCTAGGIAALICFDLVLNGYSDWYLPSKDELNQMYLQKNAIGSFSGVYWSSSETSAGSAWGQSVDSGSQGPLAKTNACDVRAIRAF